MLRYNYSKYSSIIGLIAFTLLTFLSFNIDPIPIKAQCFDEAHCLKKDQEQRMRLIVVDGCVLRVHYTIVLCLGVCELAIDSVDYPMIAQSCSSCVNDLNLDLFEAIERQLIMHGMFFTKCATQPGSRVYVRKAACWSELNGSGSGGISTKIRACAPFPCCFTAYDVFFEPNGLIIGIVRKESTTIPPNFDDCESFGAGCTNTCAE